MVLKQFNVELYEASDGAGGEVSETPLFADALFGGCLARLRSGQACAALTADWLAVYRRPWQPACANPVPWTFAGLLS